MHRGLGVFAQETIPAYTKIISERALISIREGESLPEIFQQYEALPLDKQSQFMQCHKEDKTGKENLLSDKLLRRGFPPEQVPLMVKVAAIFQANSFNVRDLDADQNPSTLYALFPTIARLNHSCVPNAHTYFNPVSKTMDVHTIASVPKGKEVEISYFNVLLPRTERLAKARDWQFECTCPACSPSSSSQQEHGSRRTRVRNLENKYLSNMMGQNLNSQQHVAEMQEMVELVAEDDCLAGQLPKAYEYLSMSQIASVKEQPSPELIVSIVMNLREAMLAEARITGHDSAATEERRQKYEMMQGKEQKIAK